MNFKALVIENEEGVGKLTYQNFTKEPLNSGEVFVKVAYSGINYKDSLALDPKSKVVRNYPMVSGIDFAGVVVESLSSDFKEGDQVFLTGLGYGTDKFGGYQEFVTAKGNDLLHLPEGMTLKEAMVYGTSGLTAALSVEAILAQTIRSKLGSFLITGGTGGVASHGILILKELGYHVVASSRELTSDKYLKTLGADEVLLFSSFLEKRKPLSAEKYQGIIDATGGEAVGNLLTELEYGGAMALSGNLAGAKFESTVFPFILRGISLIGIDSVKVSMEKKKMIFAKLAKEYKSKRLMKIVSKEIPFIALKEELLSGRTKEGRILVSFS